MNNCGCKRPAFGPEPHAPVPLHGGGFVPNAIEWLKKRIDKLFGTAVFTVNGKAPTGGDVKIVLDDLADKDGNIETTKNIMVSRDGGESHDAVALYSDLTNVIDAHNNDEVAHPKLMATVARVFATKTEVDAKADKSALQAEVDRAQAAEAQLTTKDNELDTAKADKSALNAHVENTDNPHKVTAEQVGALRTSRANTDKTFDWNPSEGDVRLFGAYYGTGIGLSLNSVGGMLRNYHDDTYDWYEFPTGESGTLALTSDIADAVKNKADKATTLAGYGITDAATKTDVEAKADKTALQAEVDRAQAAETQLTTKANELDTAKADKSALNAHVNNKDNPHAVTAGQVGAVPLVEDRYGNKTAVTVGSRKSGSIVGQGSFAAGFDVSASEDYSHAEGQETNASGLFSHAEGFVTTAEGFASHTEGGKARTLSGHTLAFAWNGDNSRLEDDPYTSHGEGTFNINPAGGLGGFWIGEQTLAAILALKADRASLALEYSATSAYSVGAIVYHDGNIYQCKTAIAAGGEAWNAAHWELMKLSDFFTESNSLLTATIDTEVLSKGTAPDAHLEAPTDEHLKLILADNSVAYDSAKALPYKLTSVIGDRVIATMTLTAASTDITLPTIAANDTTVKDFILDVTNAYTVEGVATDAGINIPRTDFKLVTRDGESLTAVTTVKAGKCAFICFTQKSPVVVDGTTYPCWCVTQLTFGDPS